MPPALIFGIATSPDKPVITRAVAIAGKHHDVGEIVEIDDATGRQMIAMDKARVPVAKKGKRSAKND